MEESGLLDGALFCKECGVPMLSDGKGHYAHIYQLTLSGIRKLIMDISIADGIADWFIGLEAKCPDCGEGKHPFSNITKGEFMAHVRDRKGAGDFARTIKDFFRPPAEEKSQDCAR